MANTAEKKSGSADSKTKKKKGGFFKGVKDEWKKIIWPAKEELGKQTVLVVVLSVLTGVIITAIDSGASILVNWLLSIG